MDKMKQSLGGRYKLLSHGTTGADGKFKPTSPFFKGELFYNADGSLTVLIIFSEKPQLAKDVFSYLGSYKIVSDKVVEHHITLSSIPRLWGTVEKREYTFDGHKLTLAKLFDDGELFEAVWEKQ